MTAKPKVQGGLRAVLPRFPETMEDYLHRQKMGAVDRMVDQECGAADPRRGLRALITEIKAKR